MTNFDDLGICLRSFAGVPGNAQSIWDSVDLRINADSFSNDYARMEDEDIRLGTFLNFPLGTLDDHKLLAMNYIFYTGVNTRVQCAFCCGIANYRIVQDSLIPDRNIHYLDCPVNHRSQHLHMVKALFDRPEVRILLDYGFSRGRIRNLISRRLCAGQDCLTASTLLAILEEES